MLKCDKCKKDILPTNIGNLKFNRKVDKKVEEVSLDLCDTCKHELDSYIHDCLENYVEGKILCPQAYDENNPNCTRCANKEDCKWGF